jgi:ABC-type maltose transport system permease subunit
MSYYSTEEPVVKQPTALTQITIPEIYVLFWKIFAAGLMFGIPLFILFLMVQK